MSTFALRERDFAFLGAGIIAGVFIERLISFGVPPGKIIASDALPEKAQALAERLGIRAARDNREAAAGGGIVFLAVPPNAVKGVLEEVRDALRPGGLIVSLAAAVRTEWIEQSAGGACKVVRVIPNTPSLVGAGMNPHCLGRHVTEADLPLVDALLAVFGDTVRLGEDQMETITALTAVGPTYVFPVMEALRDAAVAAGLDRETAQRAAAQTVAGAARLVLETGRPPEELKQMIGTRTLAEDPARELFREAFESAFSRLKTSVAKLGAAWQPGQSG
ncbi:MAG: pyrroline-5-carboxylate reductase family protein [Bryobacteraceae bacterium]